VWYVIGVATLRALVRTGDQTSGDARVKVDYARLIWEDIIHKLSKKTSKRLFPVVGPPFTDHMKAIWNLDVPVDSKASKPSSHTEESSLAKDKSPSHPSPPILVVGEMHKESHQVTGGPTSLGATSKDGAHPQLSSDSIAEVDPGLSAPNDSIPSQQDQTKYVRDGLRTAQTDSGTNKESRADENSKKIKMEDLSDLLKDIRSAFFTPDSPQDEPIIILDKRATTKDIPSAGQATASPDEGEKNTTKDAKTNLQNKPVDLLGIDVVEQYHNKKLLFDKYYDKMLKEEKFQRS
nr:hypothetical protein [Tanacetum cinerariifolium]